jgi:hypothetical protein
LRHASPLPPPLPSTFRPPSLGSFLSTAARAPTRYQCCLAPCRSEQRAGDEVERSLRGRDAREWLVLEERLERE